MQPHPPAIRRLRVTPAIETSDAEFLAGLSRHAIPLHGEEPALAGHEVTRIWPGQPVVASPWVPCAEGCCLVLAATRPRDVETAGQWLRFLVREFLGHRHRLDGLVGVPAPTGRRPVLLVVEAGEVFEGEIDDGTDALNRRR